MTDDLRQTHFEELMHRIHEDQRELRDAQKEAANDRAVHRCLLRDDVLTAELREDGSILCTSFDGSQTLRMAGWRGRA